MCPAWYIKAAAYLRKHIIEDNDLKTRVAFVSTNSITQGEQVGILWNEMFNRYKIKIHFAHRTFKWSNEAKGNAAVHVVIIGFSNFDITDKFIYEYDDIKGEPKEKKVANISPYLVEGRDMVVFSRTKPLLDNIPLMYLGNVPRDDGNYIFTNEAKEEFLRKEPEAEQFFKPIVGAKEFLNGEQRWCLWLKDALPEKIKPLKEVCQRIENVGKFREKSTRQGTRKQALYPTLCYYSLKVYHKYSSKVYQFNRFILGY